MEQRVEGKKRNNDTKVLMVVDDDPDMLTIIKQSLEADVKIDV